MRHSNLSHLFDPNAGGTADPVATRVSSMQRRRARVFTRMLDLELVSGERVAFPYGTLFEVRLNPSRGLILTFSTHVVTIEGVYLLGIYDAIVNQSAFRLRAVGDRPKRLVKDEALIFSISATERS